MLHGRHVCRGGFQTRPNGPAFLGGAGLKPAPTSAMPSQISLARGARRTRVAVSSYSRCQTAPASAQASAGRYSFSFPGTFSARASSHSRFSFFCLLLLHSISPFSSPPLHCGAALHRFRAPIRGVEERRQAPGCRVRTRFACHDRHAGHQTRRPALELGGAPPALHRGDFWFAQRIAACGIPFGLVPACLPLPCP